MTAWVARLLGQALVWLVVLAITVPMFALALPVIAFGLIGRGLYELVRALVGCGEVDGLSDGGEPDALTPGLRDQIDGRRTAAAGEVRAFLTKPLEDELPCGCSESECGEVVDCPRCDWRSCYEHREAAHQCGSDAIRSWQNAPLPPAVAASVNTAFEALINRSNVGDLKRTDEDLARFYLIGDEK